jgi:hypothetical protein
MALTDLKTDLKSLKFESGLNRKPLIVKDIDKEGGRNSGLAVQGILAAKRLDDTIRMAKLVIAKPGITHVVKQALTGFISAVDKKALYKGTAALGKELLDEGKDILLTALTNIGQTPLNGLGLHLYKGSKEFGGVDVRDYIKRTYTNEYNSKAGKRIIQSGHSNALSAGIKKSKKLPLSETDSDKAKYGRINYTSEIGNSVNTADPINALKISRGESIPSVFDDQMDLIPFGFSVYDQETPINIRFRAFLDSFSDTFTGNWNSTRYLGNPQQFRTYDGFDRQLSMGFKIAALTREELIPIYRKLNVLVSTTAPNYDIDGLFMRGTWCKITVGDYLKQTPCTISSVGLSWQQDYPWEIKQDKDEDDVMIVPHVLDVNLSAVLEHNFIPQAGVIPFIGDHTNKDFINSEDGQPESGF